jgi:hypothetical protein
LAKERLCRRAVFRQSLQEARPSPWARSRSSAALRPWELDGLVAGVGNRAQRLGVEADVGARGRRVLHAVDDRDGRPADDDVDLFLLARSLVVLWDSPAGLDLDEIHAE